MYKILLLLLTITLCFTKTILIPENYSTIQAGIDASVDGDGVDDITDIIGSAPDMGAYEFGESSEIMSGDTNFDGIVNILNIIQIVNYILRF